MKISFFDNSSQAIGPKSSNFQDLMIAHPGVVMRKFDEDHS